MYVLFLGSLLELLVPLLDFGLFVWWEIATVVAVLQLEKNFVLAKFVTSGYWIFIAFVLFHFIGLVAAVVLGFARVPVLSSWWLRCSLPLF
ncbi:hypothetical protein D5086_017183 [Populus alba]|uniref:Uncharacterized protein n=1 Tax=Populus alba TaxID=43335 RepID=A0ACC4BWR3_POPAL